MSVSRPARCIFSCPISRIRPQVRSRKFHISSPTLERRRPRNGGNKLSDPEVAERKQRAYELFKAYTSQEKNALQSKYTPPQLKTIEAGETAIDPVDLERSGVIRSDMAALPYFDDLSSTRSVLDREQVYEGPLPTHMRPMTEDEFWASWVRKQAELRAKAPPPPPTDDPDDPEYQKKLFPTRVDQERIAKEMDLFMGKDGPVPRYMTPSYEAPALPINFMSEDGKKMKKGNEEDDVDPRDPDGLYNRLIKQTGLTLDEILDYKVKILVKHRVVNQTRLGKIASLYCLAIAGNANGRLGIGEAKGQEIEETQSNARIAAIRSMQPIPRYEDRTIFGEVSGKVSAVVVKLMSRPPGFGLRCQHNIFEMARAAGIQDLAAKVPRSRNKMNTIKATYQALMKQRIPDEVARGLGKKLVDVRKVYYGGRV